MSREYWNKIDKLKDYQISYLLFLEGKSIYAISIIRNEDIKKIEKDIIKSKMEFQKSNKPPDFLVEIMSLNKDERIEKLQSLNIEEREKLVEAIYTRYTNFKSIEDRMILIWLIGELNSDKLLPFLKMELKANRFNQKRLACSALGKLKRESTKEWLEEVINDENPQVRQYAIKALKDIGDNNTIEYLNTRKNIEEKEYVLSAIDETIDAIKIRFPSEG